MHKNIMRIILLPLLAFSLATAHASEGGESKGGGAYTKLESITVNLADLSRYLQIQITVKAGNPEMAETIKMYMPVVRHALILLLSSKSPEEISTEPGKQKLMDEAKIAVNKAAELKPTHGVVAVLFESFIIQ
ncbi:MAG: flagellar basal body-associated FliL family protein [Betaproteobacteria bacterium]|nr:flagellar basal body-associated FliL family protein [Betaproteobacteria bacterium]